MKNMYCRLILSTLLIGVLYSCNNKVQDEQMPHLELYDTQEGEYGYSIKALVDDSDEEPLPNSAQAYAGYINTNVDDSSAKVLGYRVIAPDGRVEEVNWLFVTVNEEKIKDEAEKQSFINQKLEVEQKNKNKMFQVDKAEIANKVAKYIRDEADLKMKYNQAKALYLIKVKNFKESHGETVSIEDYEGTLTTLGIKECEYEMMLLKKAIEEKKVG